MYKQQYIGSFERGDLMDDKNKLDVRRAYEAIGQILGDRYNVKVTLTDLRKKDDTEEKTA